MGRMGEIISRALTQYPNLCTVGRSHFSALSRLERSIFPTFDATFDESCIRRAKRYFSHTIVVGMDGNHIASYMSLFPLDERGLSICMNTSARGICEFPVELFRIHRNPVVAIFFEVIAISNDCTITTGRQTKELAIQLLRKFSYLPMFSCPITEEGLRLLVRRGFHPLASPGLDSLYVREPEPEGA